jgi:hypothetical protein
MSKMLLKYLSAVIWNTLSRTEKLKCMCRILHGTHKLISVYGLADFCRNVYVLCLHMRAFARAHAYHGLVSHMCYVPKRRRTYSSCVNICAHTCDDTALHTTHACVLCTKLHPLTTKCFRGNTSVKGIKSL